MFILFLLLALGPYRSIAQGARELKINPSDRGLLYHWSAFPSDSYDCRRRASKRR